MTNKSVMPAVFIGHGSPMNALEDNRYTEAWHAFGRSVPRPRAILSISAHWLTRGTLITSMERPRTIYDFGGFPPELSAVRYDAPGAPDLAREIAELVAPIAVAADPASWGLDHGTWSILVHMFPDADVPVVQLSLDASKTPEEHIALGAALDPLRERGVLIMGSGNVVHNLGRIDWGSPEGASDWAESFDESVRSVMTTHPAEIADVVRHPAWSVAVPTDEHFLPLLYLAGLADASSTTAEMLIGGHAYGSLSMTSFVVPGGN